MLNAVPHCVFVSDAPTDITISSDPGLEDTLHPEGIRVDVHCVVNDCYPTPTLSLQQSDIILKSTDNVILTHEIQLNRTDNKLPLKCCAGGSHVDWEEQYSNDITPDVLCKLYRPTS